MSGGIKGKYSPLAACECVSEGGRAYGSVSRAGRREVAIAGRERGPTMEVADAAAEDEKDDDPTEYVWEGLYDRPWEAVVTQSDGTLRGARHREHGKNLADVQTGVRRAVMRSVMLVIDASRAVGVPDPEFKPSRLAAMVDVASAFVKDFFEQNPISTLAVLTMRDGRAEQLTEASCNPRQHLNALTNLGEAGGRGDASLQNALELAREALQVTPPFTSREVVMMCANLATSDPADIFVTIDALQKEKLRVSVFSLCAEVFICKKVASDTGGEYGVPTSPAHMRELVLELVAPRPVPAATDAAPNNALVRVGFPRRRENTGPVLGFSPGGGATPTLCDAPYRCPECEAAHTELPTQCPVCGLKLMSAIELTKTYHHLFPIPGFKEASRVLEEGDEPPPAKRPAAAPPAAARKRPPSEEPTHASSVQDLARDARPGRCFACAEAFPAGGVAGSVTGFVCPRCERAFCAHCDELIHSVIRTCPGCEMALGGIIAPPWRAG